MEYIPSLSPGFVAGKYKSRATNNTKANSRCSTSQVLKSALPRPQALTFKVFSFPKFAFGTNKNYQIKAIILNISGSRYMLTTKLYIKIHIEFYIS